MYFGVFVEVHTHYSREQKNLHLQVVRQHTLQALNMTSLLLY